ncbi:MAG: chalcone isomerase family protein [Acidobacteriota bacterium]|nr:chalcone isomerase family protein [Acidobacteriota bacterium]
MRNALFVSLLSLLLVGPATAGTLAEVTLPDKVEVSGQSLALNGLALRKKFFVKVYVAGLYLATKETAAARILAADAPRRMVLHFVYSVSAAQMCDAWKEGLDKNVPRAEAEVRKGFTTLCAWMEPIEKGNELVLTYVPGTGTQVQINGKQKGTLPGKPTADAIVSTWIGPDPAPGQDFKKALLGG